jgi:flagellar FliJ protein
MSSHFRLGVVLRLREMAEDAARARLSGTLRDHREAVADLARLRAEAADEAARASEVQLGSTRPGGSEAGDLVDAIEAVEQAERSVSSAQQRVAAAAEALMTSRRELAEAAKRREVVERLRDRFLVRERLGRERLEEATLNEIASTRHAWAIIEEQAP